MRTVKPRKRIPSSWLGRNPERFSTTVNWARIITIGAIGLLALNAGAQSKKGKLPWTTTGNAELDAWFEKEVTQLEEQCLDGPVDGEEWNRERPKRHEELREMLGLLPWPERTPLKAQVTGKVEGDGFRVENLHFQSLPKLYVTANLYLPEKVEKPLPAILYVCGHARSEKDGIRYGNKTSYHHHGVWFARNGYVCLVIDTIQRGEFPGIHHGTYRHGMWWWNSRGYTPAGVEAWNGMRALDYLETRPEVDKTRFGVTGRSGGGAYSWWVSTLDERIKAAAPVAGITDLRNHVVDGCVEGHCDCMFFVNTYRWDYPMLAAMVAPRPLLILNSDDDRIFPLDGVVRTHAKVAKVYEALGAKQKLGLVITPGPHKDTQELRVPAFRWFNKWLKGDESPIREPAEKILEPEQLKVFAELPEDEITTKVHETFVPVGGARTVLADSAGREEWLKTRREEIQRLSLAAWPEELGPVTRKELGKTKNGDWNVGWDSIDAPGILPVTIVKAQNKSRDVREHLIIHVLGEAEWQSLGESLLGEFHRLEAETIGVKEPADREEAPPLRDWLREELDPLGSVHVFVAPLGVGPTAFPDDARKQIQIRRRFQLLGWTLDGFRALQIRAVLRNIRSEKGVSDLKLHLYGSARMGTNVMLARLFEPPPARLIVPLELKGDDGFREGADYLNILRLGDYRQFVGDMEFVFGEGKWEYLKPQK